MAGGSEWFLESKSDELETVQIMVDDDGDGTQETNHYFRQKKVSFTITRQVPIADVTTGEGDLGKTSGILLFSLANILKSRALPKDKFFCCTADNTEKIQEAARYFLQRQTWTYIGKAKEYDPETGQDL